MKRLLFYGNCHLSVLSQWIEKNYSHKFEVIDCKKAGLNPFWKQKDKNFALWSTPNRPKQEEAKPLVHQAIKECDCFIFQPHEGNALIPELKTSFLIENIVNGRSIGIHNARMSVYPTSLDSTSLVDLVKYVRTNITTDPKQVIKYLTTELDQRFFEIVEDHNKTQQEGNNNFRSFGFELSVCLLDFMERRWKTDLLFCTINHPTPIYYRELIHQLFRALEEPLTIVPKLNDIEYPDTVCFINPLQFNFFRKICPNLRLPKHLELNELTEQHIISLQ